MFFPGVIRKINKNIPNLLQVIFFICLIHYLGQGVLLKVQRKFQLGRYARFQASDKSKTDFMKKSMFLKKVNKKMIGPSAPTTTTTPPPRPPYSVTEAVMDGRLRVLQQGCKKWNLGLFSEEGRQLSEDDEKQTISLPRSPLYQALFVSEKYKISFCPVVRAGLTWISKRLLEISGEYALEDLSKKNQPPSVLARNQFPFLSSWEKYIEVLPHYTNFIAVRHPFDRLLASYRSILEDAERDPHNYLKYGRRIVRTYRKESKGGKEPTFSEFITFVIERDIKLLDDGWQPVARRCTPCHIPYTVVLHYETLWNDALWTWEEANLKPINTTDYVSNSITPEIRRKYFSEITIHQLAKLYNRYKLDFDLFDYNLDEHMLYVQPGDEPLTSDILKALPLSKNSIRDVDESDTVSSTSVFNTDEIQINDSQFKVNNDIYEHPEVVAPSIPN